MRLWDYKLPKDWRPEIAEEWQWFLVRKINYGDFKGLRKKIIKKYFPQIKNQLDPGKKMMLEHFLKDDGTNKKPEKDN